MAYELIFPTSQYVGAATKALNKLMDGRGAKQKT
jgi:hypothetical protein